MGIPPHCRAVALPLLGSPAEETTMFVRRALFMAAFALTGCSVSAGVGVTAAPPADGSVTVDWSIEGTKDPNACDAIGATTLELAISRAGDRTIDVFDDPCDAFASSVTLAPGDYSATAILLD